MHCPLFLNRMNLAFGIALVALCTPQANSDTLEGIRQLGQFRDSHNRTFIPQGFVANTRMDGKRLHYRPSDYQQMARYGANFQVIRIGLGRLGGWPGRTVEAGYPELIDAMIENAASAGIKTGLKMVVYDIENFRHGGWEAMWKNEHREQERLIAAWRPLWKRYRDNPNVFAYDLLNEPMRGGYEDPAVLQREVLVPLYRNLIDALHEIDDKKWACFQPIHTEPQVDVFSAFAPWQIPLERERIIYAPHTYEGTLSEIPLRLDAYAREAKLSNAKMLLGEWGPPTRRDWDTNWEDQVSCQRIYAATCHEVDIRSIGTVKAWFTGTIRWVGREKNATWAIFTDKQAIGTTERKYILDYLCRPRPLAVAGEVGRFAFDFATRTFSMQYTPRTASAPTELYVPVNRHYPDGFRLIINNVPIAELQITPEAPGGRRLKIITGESKAWRVSWEPWGQRLIIHEHAKDPMQQLLEIRPGFTRAE